MLNENENYFYEFYGKSKLTIDELKRFPGCEGKSDEELSNISDGLFDLAVLYQKIMIENDDRPETI